MNPRCPSTPQSLTPKMMQLRFGANSPRPSPFYSPSSNLVQHFRCVKLLCVSLKCLIWFFLQTLTSGWISDLVAMSTSLILSGQMTLRWRWSETTVLCHYALLCPHTQLAPLNHRYPGPVTQLHPQHKRLLIQKRCTFPRWVCCMCQKWSCPRRQHAYMTLWPE